MSAAELDATVAETVEEELVFGRGVEDAELFVLFGGGF